MILTHPGQRVVLDGEAGTSIPATVVHVPSQFHRRVLVELEPGFEIFGVTTIAVRRTLLRRAPQTVSAK